MMIPLDGSTFLYDTPGIPTDNSIIAKLPSDEAKAVYPDRAVKKKTVNLSEGEGVGFGGLCLLELHKGEKTALDCYVSSYLPINKKSEKGVKNYFSELNDKSTYPKVPSALDAQSFDAFDIEVTEEGDRDIGVEGLGFFSFKGNGQTWRIFVPKGVAVYTTRAKVRKDDQR